MSALLSAVTTTAVGLTCKAVLNLGFCSATVDGLQHLKHALAHDARNNGQGVVTVSNHISTLDDPVVWGVLPAHYYLNPRKTRWALGASDVMFTNPIFSTFFRLGQTLETFRGKGVYQLAVDTAIQKLDQGDWVHLYSEGKINQPNTYPLDETGVVRLPRFKWGVGRILMETAKIPVIIPMWLTGFEKLMPEGRPFPYKYLPRPGARLSVTFGSPLSPEEIQQALTSSYTKKVSEARPTPNRSAKGFRKHGTGDQDTLNIRAAVTAVVQEAVESLGRSVCGDTLTR